MAVYPYFRISGQSADLALLPVALRDDQNLASLAQLAEADTIDEYTRGQIDPDGLAVSLDSNASVSLNVDRYVWLRGYAIDPNDAHPALASALRREIANVIRWRHARENKKPNVTNESGGNPTTSKSYRDDAEQRLPPDFGAALRPFALNRIAWAL